MNDNETLKKIIRQMKESHEMFMSLVKERNSLINEVSELRGALTEIYSIDVTSSNDAREMKEIADNVL